MSEISPPSPELPDTAARYRILGEIARGGMGVVYRVKDIDMDRVVAMKVLSQASKVPEGDAPTDYFARFIEEVQVTAKLDHPAIVPVHEVGFDDDGIPFYTMRYVKGRHLGEIIDAAQKGEQAWTLVRFIEVLVTVCQALAHAHGKGVLHRDLKPSNIMVGDLGEVYVMDWGLARMLVKEDARDIRLEFGDEGGLETIDALVTSDPAASIDHPLMTMDGAVVGTPAYMPPEQADGRVDEVDHLSDVYSLGSILYHMLAGHPPYMPSDSETSATEILTKLRAEPPARILRNDLKLSPELMAICDKAMARDRPARYQSALSLSEDLQAFVDGRVVKAHRTGVVIELKKWVQRHRMTASLVTLALFFGLVGILWQWRETRRERDEARWQSYRSLMVTASNAVQLKQHAQLQDALDSVPAEHINWEHHYFSSQLDQSLQTHAFPVYYPHSSQSIHGKGDRIGHSIYRRGEDTRKAPATIWNLQTGALERFPNHSVLSPDLTRLIQVQPDGGVAVIDTDSGQILYTYNPRAGELLTDAFFSNDPDYIRLIHSDSQSLWNPGADKLLKLSSSHGDANSLPWVLVGAGRVHLIWPNMSRTLDLNGGMEISQGQGSSVQVTQTAVSPDGSVAALAEAFPSCDIQIWDLETGKIFGRLKGHTYSVICLSFDPTGTRLVSGGYDHSARLWDLQSLEEIATLDERRSNVLCAAFNEDGSLVATGTDQTVHLWDGKTGGFLKVLSGHIGGVVSVTFARTDEGEMLASTDRYDVRIWGTHSGSHGVMRGHENFVYGIAISPDGSLVVSGSRDETVRLWDLEAREVLTIIPFEERVSSLAFSPNGRYVAAAGATEVHWWPVEDKSHTKTNAISSWVGANAMPSFSADSKRIMVPNKDGLRIWDVETGERLPTIPAHHNESVDAAAFSPDGSQLATSVEDHVYLWDAQSLQPLGVLEPTWHGLVQDLIYSRDGALLADSGQGIGARIWDVRTQAQIAHFPSNGPIYDVLFSNDASRLFTACEDGLIRIWDVANQQMVGALYGHESSVHALAMSPNGCTLVSCGRDRTVRIWAITSSK